MKKHLLFGLAITTAASLWAASPSERETIDKAVARLQTATNYSWTANYTMANAGGGKVEGKADKAGQVLLSMQWGDSGTGMEMVLKGTNGAVKRDGEWKSFADLAAENGQGQRFLRMLQDFKTPTMQLGSLVKYAKDLKLQEGIYSAELTPAGVKELLSFGRSLGGTEVSNPKGSVKFWIKEGALTKYEFHTAGTMTFDGNDRDLDITTTVELKDVGATKLNVPAEAAKKLGS